MIQFDEHIFSNGLKPPTRLKIPMPSPMFFGILGVKPLPLTCAGSLRCFFLFFLINGFGCFFCWRYDSYVCNHANRNHSFNRERNKHHFHIDHVGCFKDFFQTISSANWGNDPIFTI